MASETATPASSRIVGLFHSNRMPESSPIRRSVSRSRTRSVSSRRSRSRSRPTGQFSKFENDLKQYEYESILQEAKKMKKNLVKRLSREVCRNLDKIESRLDRDQGRIRFSTNWYRSQNNGRTTGYYDHAEHDGQTGVNTRLQQQNPQELLQVLGRQSRINWVLKHHLHMEEIIKKSG